MRTQRTFFGRWSTRGASRVCAPILVVGLMVALSGCDDPEAERVEKAPIVFDLETCMGSSDAVAGDCRERLTSALPTSGANACLVIAEGVGNAAIFHRRLARWADRALTPVDNAPLELPSGQTINARLFFLGANAADRCQLLQADSVCDGSTDCVLSLGPATATVSENDPTRINFTQGGACQTAVGSAPQDTLQERCDGIDNDCDGRADESFSELGDLCSLGTGPCAQSGMFECGDDGDLKCNAVPSEPGEEGLRPDMLDNDCDGTVDEGTSNENCTADAECGPAAPVCIDGVCQGCRPGTNMGCSEVGAEICGDDLMCRGCVDDAECGEGRFCVNWQGARVCGVCDPNRDNLGCAPDSIEAICDESRLECRGCIPNNSDCGTGFCDNGRCGACQGMASAGCSNPLPICERNENGNICRGCENSAECTLRNTGRNVCDPATQQCVVCLTDGSNEGCTEPLAPVCRPGAAGGESACTSCQDNDECPGPLLCNPSGRCGGCNLATHEGCSGATPVCTNIGGENICVRCEGGDASCDGVEAARGEGELVCTDSGRCAECDIADNRGCDLDSNQPLCRNFACAGCVDDPDCGDLGGNRLHCNQGYCDICDPNGNVGCDQASEPICDLGGGERACRACRAGDDCGDDRQCSNGFCGECRPGPNGRNDCPSERPVCLQNRGEAAACVRCSVIAPCAAGLQCLDSGQCAECNPANNAGCDADRPICDDAGGEPTCRGCLDDDECGGGLCVAPRCQGCQVGTNEGCGGLTPICRNGRECTQCVDDAECGPASRCVSEVGCVECRPATQGDDCPQATPFCDAAEYECRSCVTGDECASLGLGTPLCQNNTCVRCTPEFSGDGLPFQRGCDADNPICTDGPAGAECRRCENDQECGPDSLCTADGRCGACDPMGNEGCDDANRPSCDPETLTCRRCEANGECVSNLCDEGSGICEACAAGELCADGRVCRNGSCQECVNDGECRGDLCRPINGTRLCVRCDPMNGDGCPRDDFCRPDGLACVQCTANVQCADSTVNPRFNGTLCIDYQCGCDPNGAPFGSCVIYRNALENSSSTVQVCRALDDDPQFGECGECEDSTDCEGHPRGWETCIGGRCRTCNLSNDAGCPATWDCTGCTTNTTGCPNASDPPRGYLCVPTVGCSPETCPAPFSCSDEDRCVPPACGNSNDCPERTKCHLGECRVNCNNDADCPDGTRCQNDVRLCE